MSKIGKALGLLAGRKPEVPTPAGVVYEKLEVKTGTARTFFAVGVALVVVALVVASLLVAPVVLTSAFFDIGVLFSESARLAYLFGFLASLVPPLLVLVWVLYTDKYEPEPKYAILTALGIGAVLGAVASPLVIYSGESLLALLASPFIYETFKVSGLVILLTSRLQKEFNDHVDGFVYGASVGAGFAIVNSAVDFIQGYFNPAPGIVLLGTPVAGLVLSQALASVLHILSTGFAGFWLGYERVIDGVVSGRDMVPALLVALVIGYAATLPLLLGFMGIIIRVVILGYLLFAAERVLVAALKDEIAWGYAAGKAPVES